MKMRTNFERKYFFSKGEKNKYQQYFKELFGSSVVLPHQKDNTNINIIHVCISNMIL